MLNLGFGEMVVLAAIALIAIGPKQLPDVARTLGRFLNEMKRATGDFTRTIVDARDNTNRLLNLEEANLYEDLTRASESVDPLPKEEGLAFDEHQQMSFEMTVETDSADPVSSRRKDS